MANRRLSLYRSFQKKLIEQWLLPRVFSEKRSEKAANESIFASQFSAPKSGVKRVWFHAASVGELESLWTVIEEFARQENAELILTIFSESAEGAIGRLVTGLSPGKVLFHGYAPWEGRWEEALVRASPTLFVTAKYEAWPELWASLATREIPLLLVGAMPRKSLGIAKRACQLLGTRLPRMIFLSANPEDAERLKGEFPQAQIHIVDDPRWDRVEARTKVGNVRAKLLVEQANALGLPRPWGILGSAWKADLDVWKISLSVAGTVFVVPHKVDAAHVEPLREALALSRGSVWTSSKGAPQLGDGPVRTVLVDEMGFLSELYTAADWAYVGGGFGAGVHSTIEPALQGLPIASGPARAGSFPEITELLRTEQLRLVRDEAELTRWVKEGESLGWWKARRGDWRIDAARRLGATGRVLSLFP